MTEEATRSEEPAHIPWLWLNVTASALVVLLLIAAFLPILHWAVLNAVWHGSADTCRAASGACWAFIDEKKGFIFFGLYPREGLWQAVMASVLILIPAIISIIPRFWHPRLLLLWITSLTLAVLLMRGTIGTVSVPTSQWGGFPLTLLLSIVGFAGAFPVGTLAAYGRRSQMGLIRLLSTAFIEVLRGLPLITVLYFCTLLFPLMWPGGSSIDKLLRTQIALILFVAAYIAEIVRAGLSSVDRGQDEAAKALGLGWWQVQKLVILPQALRAVIPAFVTLGIGIFLDTTLVTVIGLFDFLNTARTAATDAQWLGFYTEGYIVVAVVYFVISYGLSRYSLWLEAYLLPTARGVKQS